ncbi:MAG TPA: hypothetical protein VMF03_02405 [Steroidobacteraceae bacterium]|nr:hypothetical protein [Steroidobacteraceae bacterium]
MNPAHRENLDYLASRLGSKPYLTDTSDVVALLFFEHRPSIYRNLITPRIEPWPQAPTESLVQAMPFADA